MHRTQRRRARRPRFLRAWCRLHPAPPASMRTNERGSGTTDNLARTTGLPRAGDEVQGQADLSGNALLPATLRAKATKAAAPGALTRTDAVTDRSRLPSGPTRGFSVRPSRQHEVPASDQTVTGTLPVPPCGGFTAASSGGRNRARPLLDPRCLGQTVTFLENSLKQKNKV